MPGAADAKDNERQRSNDQEQLIDPQAPLGTEAKSTKNVSAKAELDSPVETEAADPDTAHRI